jgi:hypothetical protein
MKSNPDKQTRQSGVISELCQAQQKGFVLQIEVELQEKYGKIVYEPRWQMYRNNEANDPTPITEPDDLKDLPSYLRVLVTFNSTVTEKSIGRISKYVCQRYKCRSELLKGNKIAFFEF